MTIGRITSGAAWLLITAVVAGCASQAGSVRDAPEGPEAANISLETSAISADEFRDLANQPSAEQRHRLDVVLASHPADLAAHILRLRAEDDLADYPAMIADSEFILATPSLKSPIRLEVLTCRAEALIQVKRAAEALSAANQAVEIDGSNSKALFARGWARWESDRAQAEFALADLDRALQLEPGLGIGYFRRGTILKLQRKFDRAAEDFEHALRLLPDDVPTHLTYGVMSLQTKDFERARLHFDAAAGLTPSDPSVWTWRGHADVALKRFDDVRTDGNRAIELGATGEDLADAHALLAAALENQTDFAGAALEYQRSLAISADPSMAGGFARMQWYSGQFAQAIQPFRELAALPDSSPYVPLWLFVVRVRANPADEAAAKAELVALAPAHRPPVWTDTLVELMLGKAKLETALAEADAASTDRLRAGQRCEADYYTAEQFLMHGQDMAATRLLEEAQALCPSTYIEAQATLGERRLLATRAPQP